MAHISWEILEALPSPKKSCASVLVNFEMEVASYIPFSSDEGRVLPCSFQLSVLFLLVSFTLLSLWWFGFKTQPF